MKRFQSIDDVQAFLAGQRYIADGGLAAARYLSMGLNKPLFLEGEPGVGKTETAKVMADGLGRPLIRLQCYEGLTAAEALYEWNYPKQLLRIKQLEQCGPGQAPDLFTDDYLISRPLLTAVRQSSEDKPAVLLIDELDRADEAFEAFLLEVLSDFAVSIPEIGTIRAEAPPLVVLTSNRTREVHDALKRRCLYHWIDYPDPDKEYQIVMARVPEAESDLVRAVCRVMAGVREQDFFKRPGVAETLDWVRALMLLNQRLLDEDAVQRTLGLIFKYEDDLRRFQAEHLDLLKTACAGEGG
jgi:MoxR-like ATPase